MKDAEIMLNRDLLWTTVMIYYAEYYALYSFLTRIGIKCENHLCSILLTKFLLGNEKVALIEKHRKNRIDAQYYLEIRQKNEIKGMLNEAKFFVANFEEIVINLSKSEIEEFIKRTKEILS